MRQGLNDIADSFFLSPWGHYGREFTGRTLSRSAHNYDVMAAGSIDTMFGYAVHGP
jgi:hypothetical protein